MITYVHNMLLRVEASLSMYNSIDPIIKYTVKHHIPKISLHKNLKSVKNTLYINHYIVQNINAFEIHNMS